MGFMGIVQRMLSNLRKWNKEAYKVMQQSSTCRRWKLLCRKFDVINLLHPGILSE